MQHRWHGNSTDENSMNNPLVDQPNINQNPEVSFQMNITEATPPSTGEMTSTTALALGFIQQNLTPRDPFPSLQENMLSIGSIGSPKEATNELKCTWAECPDDRVFKRKCQFTKHMDKHTRPYSCQDPQCHGRDFGDRAGLQRHEKEKHGNVKFCCPVTACSRSARGFGRKRNLDLHIACKHRAQVTGVYPVTDGTIDQEASMGSTSRENTGMEESSTKVVADVGLLVAPQGIESLRATLRELEAKKSELIECQSKVDAVIDSLKKTMQLVLKG